MLVTVTPGSALAHSGPPSPAYKRCAGTVARGSVTLTGRMVLTRPQATQFYVKIIPAAPFGWSGTVTINGLQHPRVAVPVGTRHWFSSRAIIANSTFGYRVEVSPNPGVFNNYAVEIWSARPCRR